MYRVSSVQQKIGNILFFHIGIKYRVGDGFWLAASMMSSTVNRGQWLFKNTALVSGDIFFSVEWATVLNKNHSFVLDSVFLFLTCSNKTFISNQAGRKKRKQSSFFLFLWKLWLSFNCPQVIWQQSYDCVVVKMISFSAGELQMAVFPFPTRLGVSSRFWWCSSNFACIVEAPLDKNEWYSPSLWITVWWYSQWYSNSYISKTDQLINLLPLTYKQRPVI